MGCKEPIIFKYRGLWNPDDRVRSEIQIASLLIGLFWEVEHSAVYKPSPNLRGVAESLLMKERIAAVEMALKEFELEFELEFERSRLEMERSIEGSSDPPPSGDV